MTSRRALLLGGLAAFGGLGWLGGEHLSVTGEVRRKYIYVSWEVNGRHRHGRMLWSVVAPGDEINISYASPDAEGAVQSPRTITVDRGLDRSLHADFSDVTYMLGVSGTATGYSMKRVSRDGFNRAQLGDTATVVHFNDRLFVSEVRPRTGWSGSSEIRTFDFRNTYPTYQ
jgi:hypothetical protein